MEQQRSCPVTGRGVVCASNGSLSARRPHGLITCAWRCNSTLQLFSEPSRLTSTAAASVCAARLTSASSVQPGAHHQGGGTSTPITHSSNALGCGWIDSIRTCRAVVTAFVSSPDRLAELSSHLEPCVEKPELVAV
jgi:hypothetical protein